MSTQIECCADWVKILRTSPDAMVLTDVEGNITGVSKGFEKILGFTQEEVLNKTPGSVLQGPDTNPETVKRMRAAIAARETVSVDVLNYTKTKRETWIRLTIQPMFDKTSQKLIGFIGFQFNITDKVENNAKLMLLTASLQGELDLRNSVIGILSHDVRNLLQTELSVIETAKVSENVKETKQLLTQLQTMNKDTRMLFEHVLEAYSARPLANPAAATGPMSTVQVDVGKVAQKAVDLARGQCSLKQQAMTLNIPLESERPATIRAESSLQIMTIISNLLSKACKFTPDKGSVQVSVAAVGSRVVVVIADNGIGMAPSVADKFRTGERVKTTLGTHKERGTGNGLTFVREIVRRNAGKTTVDSVVGSGTTFTLTFPKYESTQAARTVDDVTASKKNSE